MDLISVIVPVYNVEKYLNKCIDSIVTQTYNNLEIILVDDGSTDTSGEICDKWEKKDKRIKVIHKRNGGLSDARNAGMSIATGEYIGFVDSDDWIDLNFYDVLIQYSKTYNADIVGCAIIKVFDDHEEKIFKKFNVFDSESALNPRLGEQGFQAVVWNKLYKKTLFDNIIFPKGKIHEDEFITYKLIGKSNKLVLCNDTFYHYRQRKGSIMSEDSCRNIDVLEAYEERCNYMKINYPKYYYDSKYVFLISCYYYYKRLNKNDVIQKSKITEYTKNIKFSLKELKNSSFKNIINIIRTKLYILLK